MKKKKKCSATIGNATGYPYCTMYIREGHNLHGLHKSNLLMLTLNDFSFLPAGQQVFLQGKMESRGEDASKRSENLLKRQPVSNRLLYSATHTNTHCVCPCICECWIRTSWKGVKRPTRKPLNYLSDFVLGSQFIRIPSGNRWGEKETRRLYYISDSI